MGAVERDRVAVPQMRGKAELVEVVQALADPEGSDGAAVELHDGFFSSGSLLGRFRWAMRLSSDESVASATVWQRIPSAAGWAVAVFRAD
jgi:hypothetical protein